MVGADVDHLRAPSRSRARSPRSHLPGAERSRHERPAARRRPPSNSCRRPGHCGSPLLSLTDRSAPRHPSAAASISPQVPIGEPERQSRGIIAAPPPGAAAHTEPHYTDGAAKSAFCHGDRIADPDRMVGLFERDRVDRDGISSAKACPTRAALYQARAPEPLIEPPVRRRGGRATTLQASLSSRSLAKGCPSLVRSR
jgi:hypothetical protein